MTEAQRPKLYGGWALVALVVAGALLVQALAIEDNLERERRREIRALDDANDELRARVRELQRKTPRTDFENLKRESDPAEEDRVEPEGEA